LHQHEIAPPQRRSGCVMGDSIAGAFGNPASSGRFFQCQFLAGLLK